MLFKLALKNIRKSIKDYSIYFFTLVIGVIIFYIFNALDTQTAMLDVSSSTREIIRLMTTFLMAAVRSYQSRAAQATIPFPMKAAQTLPLMAELGTT